MPENFDPFENLQDPNVAVAEPPLPPAPGRTSQPPANIADVLNRVIKSPEGEQIRRRHKRSRLKEELRQTRQKSADFEGSVMGNLLHLRKGDLQLAKIGTIVSGWMNRKLGYDEAAKVADRATDSLRQEQKELQTAIDDLNMGTVARTMGSFGESFIVSSPTLVVPGTAATQAMKLGAGAAAAAGLGVGAGATTGGVISGVSVYDEARENYIAQGYDEETASEMAKYPGWASGIATGLITTMFGRTGIERSALMNLPKGKFTQALAQVFRQGNLEGGEEMFDQFYQAVMGRLTHDPDLTVDQAMVEIAAAYGIGFMMGGGVEAAGQFMTSNPSEVKAAVDEAFPRPADKPMTRDEFENSPIVPREPQDAPPPTRVMSPQSKLEFARSNWELMGLQERGQILGDQAAEAQLPLEQIEWDDLTAAEQGRIFDFYGLTPEDEVSPTAAPPSTPQPPPAAPTIEEEAAAIEAEVRADIEAGRAPTAISGPELSEYTIRNLEDATLRPRITVQEVLDVEDSFVLGEMAESRGFNRGDVTGIGYHIGQSIGAKWNAAQEFGNPGKVEEAETELRALKQAYQQVHQESLALAESRDPLEVTARMGLVTKGQVLQEAIDAAEDTGVETSSKTALKKYPQWTPIRRGTAAPAAPVSPAESARLDAVTDQEMFTRVIPTTLVGDLALPEDAERLARETVFKGIKQTEFSPAQAKTFKATDAASFTKRKWELRMMGIIAPKVARGERLTFPYNAWVGKVKKAFPDIYKAYENYLETLKSPPSLKPPEEREAEETPAQDVPKDDDATSKVSAKDMRKVAVNAFLPDAQILRKAEDSKAKSSRHVLKQQAILKKQGRALNRLREFNTMLTESRDNVATLSSEIEGLNYQLSEGAVVAPTIAETVSKLQNVVSGVQRQIQGHKGMQARMQRQHDQAMLQSALQLTPSANSPTQIRKAAEVRQKMEVYGRRVLSSKAAVKKLEKKLSAYRKQLAALKAEADQTKPIDRKLIRSRIKETQGKLSRATERLQAITGDAARMRNSLMETEKAYRKAYLAEINERSGGKVDEYLEKREAAGNELRINTDFLAGLNGILGSFGFTLTTRQSIGERIKVEMVEGERVETVIPPVEYMQLSRILDAREGEEDPDYKAIATEVAEYLHPNKSKWSQEMKDSIRLAETFPRLQEFFADHVLKLASEAATGINSATAAINELHNSLASIGLTKQSFWSYNPANREFSYALDTFFDPDPNFIQFIAENNAKSSLGIEADLTIPIPEGTGQIISAEPDFEGEVVNVPEFQPNRRPVAEGVETPRSHGDIQWARAYYVFDEDGAPNYDKIVVLQESHNGTHWLVTIENGQVTEDVKAATDPTTKRTSVKTALIQARNKLGGAKVNIASALWTKDRGYEVPSVYSLSPTSEAQPSVVTYGEGNIMWAPATTMAEVEAAIYGAAVEGKLSAEMTPKVWNKAITDAVSTASPQAFREFKLSKVAQLYWRKKGRQIARQASDDALVAIEISNTGVTPDTQKLGLAFGLANPRWEPVKRPVSPSARDEYFRRALSVPRGTQDPFNDTLEVVESFETQAPRQTQILDNGSRVVSIEADHVLGPNVIAGDNFKRSMGFRAKGVDHVIITINGKIKGFFVFGDNVSEEEKASFYASVDANPSGTSFTNVVRRKAPKLKVDPAEVLEDRVGDMSVMAAAVIEQTPPDLAAERLVAKAEAAVVEMRKTAVGRELIKQFMKDAETLESKDSVFVRNMMRLFRQAVFSDRYTIVDVGDGVAKTYVDVAIPGVFDRVTVRVDETTATDEEAFVQAVHSLIDQLSTVMSKDLSESYGVTGHTFNAFASEPWEDGVIRVKGGMAEDEIKVRLKEIVSVAGLPKTDKTYKLVREKFTKYADFDRMKKLLGEVGIVAEMAAARPEPTRKPVGGKKYAEKPIGRISRPVQLMVTQPDGTKKPMSVSSGDIIPGTKIPVESAVVSRLFELYSERVREIFHAINNQQVTRGRLKSLMARRIFSEAQRIEHVRGEHAKPIVQAKSQQRNPRNQVLKGTPGKKAEELLPPQTPMLGYRLVRLKTWPSSRFLSEEEKANVKQQASYIPLGKVLIKVDAEGEFTRHTAVSLEIDLEQAKGGTFAAEAVEATLAVDSVQRTDAEGSRDIGRIMVWQPTVRDGKEVFEWKTVYIVDLKNLQNNGLARPFEVAVEGKKTPVTGWEISKEAVNNSAWWEIADSNERQWLSPEDYAKYYPHKLGLMPGDVVATSSWTSMRSETTDAEQMIMQGSTGFVAAGKPEVAKKGTFLQAIAEVAPDEFSASRFNALDPDESNIMDWLEDNLSGSAAGQAILRRIETTDPLSEVDDNGRDAWEDIKDAILVLNSIPTNEDAAFEPGQREMADNIVKALTRMRESRVAGSVQARGGRRTRMSDVNPALINQPAMGKQAIRDLVNAEDNGMSRRAKRLANLLLDVLPNAVLEDVTFVITPGHEIGGDATVSYAGSFSHIHRLARYVSTSGSTIAAAEELAHAAAQFLPTEHRSGVEEYRQKEIAGLLNADNTPEEARVFLQMIQSRDGAITSEDFMQLRGADRLTPYYHLINTDEFFAFHLTKAADRKGRGTIQKAVDKALSWMKQVLKGIKRAMRRMGAERDGYFDELANRFERGEFDISAHGGYLHEVNVDSDMGSAAVAWTASRAKRIAETTPGEVPGGPKLELDKELRGQIIGAANQAPDEIINIVKGKRVAEGKALSAAAARHALVDNFGEVIETVRDVFKVPITKLKDALTELPSVWMREHAILGASASVNFYRWKYNKVTKLRDKWVKKITSAPFIAQLTTASKEKIAVMGQDAISAQVIARIKSHIALMRSTLNNPNISPNDPRSEAAAREIDLYTTYETYSQGISQKIQQMVERLTTTEEGNTLLQDNWRNVDPAAVVQAYRNTNPPQEQLQVGNAVIEAAAYFIATEPTMRQKLAAGIYQEDMDVNAMTKNLGDNIAALMNEVTNTPGALGNLGKGDDLTERTMNLFRAARSASSAEAKAKTVFRLRQGKLKKSIARAQMYDEAASFMDEVMTSPAWVVYENEVAELAGKKHVPDNWKVVGSDPVSGTVKLPLPISKPTPDGLSAFVEVKLKDNLTEWEGERQKILHSIDEMTQWLMNNGNTDTLDAKYMKMQLQYAQRLLDSSLVNDIQGNHQAGWNFLNQFFNKWTAMWEGIARAAPVRAVQGARIAIRSWSDSMLMMNKWYQRWGDRIATVLHQAADSHNDMVDISDRPRSVYDWFELIGREMMHLANEGFVIETGNIMPDSQIVVTKEDVAALHEMTNAVDEAYKIDIVRGRGGFIPGRTVVDEFVPGVRVERRTLKLVENMLPRVFNPTAMNFTKKFVVELAGIDARQKGWVNMPGMRDHLNTHFDALKAFLSDRDSAFSKASPLEAEAYPALLEMIRDGEITNLDQFLDRLNVYTVTEDGEEEFNAVTQFWNDFYDLQKSIYSKAVHDTDRERSAAKAGRFIPFEQENSFTVGRGNRVAPYYWYNHGFHSTAQIMGFMLNGSSYYLGWAKRAVDDAASVLSDMLSDYNARIRESTGKNTAKGAAMKARKAVEQSNREAIRQNQEHIKIEDIDSTVKALRDFVKELDEVFTAEGKLIEDETLQFNRFFGLYMGGAISSFRTGIQNMLQSGLGYNAWRLQKVRGGIWKVMPGIAWRVTLGLAKLAPAAAIKSVYNVIPGVPGVGKVNYLNALKEMGMLFKPSTYKKYGFRALPRQTILMINELFSDFVQDIADVQWQKGRVYRELYERGLNNPFNTRYHLEAVAESVTTLGRINYKETTAPAAAHGPVDYLWKQVYHIITSKVLKGFLGAADVAMALTVRPFLPRAGDMMANAVAADSVFGAVAEIETHLRYRYNLAKKLGRNPRIEGTILPVDVLPRWFNMNRTNLTALSDLKNWFQGAAIDLKSTINTFYDNLDTALASDDKNAAADVRWLDGTTAWNFAQQHLEDINVATPANRPAIAKRGTINRLIFALKGWRWNMFSKIMDMAGSAMWKHDSRFKRAVEGIGNYSTLMTAFAVYGLGGAWLLEAMVRMIYGVVFGEIRSVRQVNEMATSEGTAMQALVGSASIVPMLDTAINIAFNTQPSKARLTPGGFAESAFLNLVNYGVGVVKTGDFTYGLDRLAVTTQPTIGKLVVNAMPGNSGKVEAFNASRLLTRHGDDSWLRQSRFSNQLSAQFATRYSPIAERMVNEAMQNDLNGVREEFNEGVTQMVMREGIPFEEAQKRMRSMFTSRNPYSRAYARKLTSMQRSQVLGRMPFDDRSRVQLVEQKFLQAADAIGANLTFEKAEAGLRATKTSISRFAAIRKRGIAARQRAVARRNVDIMRRSRGLLTRGRVLL